MGNIERITLFKIPTEEGRAKMLEALKVLKKTALKDGEPYIFNPSAGSAFPDPRAGEYTLGVKTTFASLEDMKFYDEACEAHKVVKGVAATVMTEPPLVLFFENSL